MNGNIMQKKISVVIPSYNEEMNIMLVYESIIKIIKKVDYDYELIYVDNNSYDNSYNIFKQLAWKTVKKNSKN